MWIIATGAMIGAKKLHGDHDPSNQNAAPFPAAQCLGRGDVAVAVRDGLEVLSAHKIAVQHKVNQEPDAEEKGQKHIGYEHDKIESPITYECSG